MTMTGRPRRPAAQSEPARRPRPTRAAEPPCARRRDGRSGRRSSVPGKDMLHEAKPLNRTRIGADVVCEALLRQGVDVFFGYPGGVVLPLYDVLGDYPELRHVLVRHEQGGGARRGRVRPRLRQGRRLPRHERPRRHQPRHRHRHRACWTRSPWSRITATSPSPHRQGRFPGDRHHRHHPADDQAQLPGPRRRRHRRA